VKEGVPLGAETSCREQPVDAFRVKPYEYLVAYHYGRSGTAIVLPNQLEHRHLIFADVFLDVLDTSLREVGLDDRTWRSTRLRKHDHLLF